MNEEAIKKLQAAMGAYTSERKRMNLIQEAIELLKADPEPTEFTSLIRENWPVDIRLNAAWLADNLRLSCEIIERLQANKIIQRKADLGLLETLKLADEQIEQLQSENQELTKACNDKDEANRLLADKLKEKDAEIERLGNAIGNCVGIIRASAQVNTKLLADKLEQALTDIERQ